MCQRFRYDIENYLATVPDPPVRTLREIEEGGKVFVTVMPTVKRFLEFEGTPDTNERCIQAAKNEEVLRQAVERAFEGADIQALIYPTWNNPPRVVGDMVSPHGSNSGILSPLTGFPAMTVPMGFVRKETLPVSLQFYGLA